MTKECKESVVINNKSGLHVRTATQLVKTAEGFDCEVFIDRKGFDRVNAKSIMSVLTLAAPQGTELTLITKGPDAQEAMDALRQLFLSSFGEGK